MAPIVCNIFQAQTSLCPLGMGCEVPLPAPPNMRRIAVVTLKPVGMRYDRRIDQVTIAFTRDRNGMLFINDQAVRYLCSTPVPATYPFGAPESWYDFCRPLLLRDDPIIEAVCACDKTIPLAKADAACSTWTSLCIARRVEVRGVGILTWVCSSAHGIVLGRVRRCLCCVPLM